jgi:hypothetical protein
MAPYLAAHYALSVDTSQGSMYDYSCLFKNGSIYTGKALNKTVEGHFAAYPQSTPAFFYYCYYQGELPSTSYAGLHYSNYWNMIGVVTLMDYLD